MRKLISALVATTIAASSLTGAALARRHHGDGDRRADYVNSYCASNPRDRDCREWRRNHSSWDDSRYRVFYRRHYASNRDANLALLFGVILSAAANANRTTTWYGTYDPNDGRYNGRYDGYDSRYGYDHEARCAAAYPNYRAEDNTFVGRDGVTYYCNL